MSLNDAQRKLQKKVWFRAKDSAKNNFLPPCLETSLAWKFLFLCSFFKNCPWTFEKNSIFNKLWASRVGLKEKIRGSQGEKLAKRGNETTAVAQKVQQKYRDTACKAIFFSFYLTQASKIYVATYHSVVRLETIEISSKELILLWIFAQEVDWCIKDCDKERLQTTAFIKVWKIFPGYTGDWFDVKTASTCTTELWDALKSFILDSLKIKVAPHPIIVSLDTLKLAAATRLFSFATLGRNSALIDHLHNYCLG